ncbi:MAG TPA: Hpt domain-containing protein, partial [Sphingomonas sp.]
MDMDEIQQIFFLECEEALQAIESNFGYCRAGTHDGEMINTIFRGVHSIKGGAGAFGHDALQSFTHHYETLLDKLRNGEVTLTPALLTVLLAAFDTLTDHIAAARGEGPVPDDGEILARLSAACTEGEAVAPVEENELDAIFDLLDEEIPASDAPDGGWRVDYRPGPNAFAHGGEPLLLLRELHRLGGTTLSLDSDAVPPLDLLDPGLPCIGWTILLPGTLDEDEIRGVFDFLDDGCSVEIVCAPVAAPTADMDADDLMSDLDFDVVDEITAPAQPAPAPIAAEPTPVAAIATPAPIAPAEGGASPQTAAVGGQTIRVDLDKLDRLVNLVGELVITQAMLAQRLSVNGLSNVTELTDLDHLTRELQDSAMSIRAQPVKTVFSRVPRIIRELETQTGKRVRLEMEGEMTEIDKTVVERIGEPLTHLIRNAVDHGLELPADREAAGKPPEGVVRLSAEHRSGRIVISIRDDGRGIDRERVRAKAVERGIIA